jgi:hypothetical protein
LTHLVEPLSIDAGSPDMFDNVVEQSSAIGHNIVKLAVWKTKGTLCP